MKTKTEKLFGEFVFTDKVLKNYVDIFTYKKYAKMKENGESLSLPVANKIAKAIMNWAKDKGATHYTHWFMPLTNQTAGKQVSFIEPAGNNQFIEKFSAKDLIKGETDASSFPNGGERMTFEARGYTVWDYTSPIFIKEDSNKNRVVYIPTAFCSYNGTALDEKTPLLRALENLNENATKLANYLGYNDVKKVNLSVGAEQEYFLIDEKYYEKRLDLKIVHRTLLGASPLKAQEMCSHYFGVIEDNISCFMNDVNKTLWRMGISAKLQHNEVAPRQYEIVPIYNLANISCDQNQIIMQTLRETAKKYDLVALLCEKPFASVNGSGKHANLSLTTNTGINIFDFDMDDKLLFYAYFVCMISAIDKYNKLIRLSTAYRDNDLRLGGHEAPPAIVSVFASDYVLNFMENFFEEGTQQKGKNYLDTKVKSLPKTSKDYCDRNRTSPFAFAGNKFEFRMVGSSQSLSFPITCISTSLSKVISDLNCEIEENGKNRENIVKILKKMLNNHKKVINNGNCYDKDWSKEAKDRGLVEYKNGISVYDTLLDDDIIDLFENTKVLTDSELKLRKQALDEKYTKTLVLEGKTILEMLNKQIFPAINEYINSLENVKLLQNKKVGEKVANLYEKLYNASEDLCKTLEKFDNNVTKEDKYLLIESMQNVREVYDEIEKYIPSDILNMPTYNDILF